MLLEPWSYPCPNEGFTLRGWYTPPTGKPLIHFIHGNGFCGRTYEPMLAHLAEHFDLWLSDIQGHGDSDHGGPFVGWNRSAQLALAAYKALGAEQFKDVPQFAMGHSFGGVLSTLLLAGRDHPFQQAVLLDPVLFPTTMLMGMLAVSAVGQSRHTPLARAALRRRNHWPDQDAAFAALNGRGAYKGWTEEALRAFVTHATKPAPQGGIELKCAPSREAEIFGSGPERLWSSVGRIRVPTLIIHGQDSFPFVGPSASRAALANTSIQTQLTEGGHCFMQEDPARAAALVRGYLLPGQ